MFLDDEGVKRLEQLKHNEEILFKVLDYMRDMFIKNNISYGDEIDIYKSKLGLTDEDLEYLDLKDDELEEKQFIDYCYHLLSAYIIKTDDKDLKELYDWYDVEYGAETSLCNIMFESLCNSYDNKRLEEEIKKIVGEC